MERLEVARQLGHSPTMTLEVYAHVFDEFDPAERILAEEAIRRARDAVAAGRAPVLAAGTR